MENVDILELELEAVKGIVDGCVEAANANYSNHGIADRIVVEFVVKPKNNFTNGTQTMLASLSMKLGYVNDKREIIYEDLQILHEYLMEVDTKRRDALLTTQIMMLRRFLTEAITSFIILAKYSLDKLTADAKNRQDA